MNGVNIEWRGELRFSTEDGQCNPEGLLREVPQAPEALSEVVYTVLVSWYSECKQPLMHRLDGQNSMLSCHALKSVSFVCGPSKEGWGKWFSWQSACPISMRDCVWTSSTKVKAIIGVCQLWGDHWSQDLTSQPVQENEWSPG